MPSRRKKIKPLPKSMREYTIKLDQKFNELSGDHQNYFCANLANGVWKHCQSLRPNPELSKRLAHMKSSVMNVLRENQVECVDFSKSGNQLHVRTLMQTLNPQEIAVVFIVDIFGNVSNNEEICICYMKSFVSEGFGDEMAGSITVDRLLMCFAIHRVDSLNKHFMEAYDFDSNPLPLVAQAMVEQECCVCFTSINERAASGSKFCPTLLLGCPSGDCVVCGNCIDQLKKCPVCHEHTTMEFVLLRPGVPRHARSTFATCDGCPLPEIVFKIQRKSIAMARSEQWRMRSRFFGATLMPDISSLSL
jgi:hypothetical protein